LPGWTEPCHCVEVSGGARNDQMTLQEFWDAVAAWAAAEPRIAAVVLVGSHARGNARPGSDVDLVVLSDATDAFSRETSWVARFGTPERYSRERWGQVTSIRVWYDDGREVEFGFTERRWAAEPLDDGTRRVVEGGLRVLFDREGIFEGSGRS
jgi:predicted nucleotidyltransferase